MLAPKFQDAQEGHLHWSEKKKGGGTTSSKGEMWVCSDKKLKKYLGIKVQSALRIILYIRLHLHERRTLHSYPQ